MNVAWRPTVIRHPLPSDAQGHETMMSLDAETKKWLMDRFGADVRFDEPMADHTSFRVGGPADAYVTPDSDDLLLMLIEWISRKNIPYLVVGDGTNLLVKDNGIRGLVIVLKKCLREIVQTDTEPNHVFVSAMAGVRMQHLCRFAIRQGLEGMNFAIGIPGTVGGGIMMNAGTSHGAVADVLKAVKVLIPPDGIHIIDREALDFGYRRLAWHTTDDGQQRIILAGHFRLRPGQSDVLQREADAFWEDRKKTQPIRFPSAGCFFKNPESGKSAGELIDRAGLKNAKIGGAAVSSKHANYIVNVDNASAADVIALMEHVQAEVFHQFNVQLEPEVKIVGA